MVLPDGSRAPSRGGSAGHPFPAQYGTGQQTPLAACGSDGAASDTLGAWGPLTTNKRHRVYTGALLATTIAPQKALIGISRCAIIGSVEFDKP